MSRLPGRKFKTDHINVDGVSVPYEVKIDDAGTFHAEVQGAAFEAKTLAEIRERVRPLLEETHRLEWDPVIELTFQEAEKTSRWDNRQDEEQMVSLRIGAAWWSRTQVKSNSRWVDRQVYKTVKAEVDPKTCEILPASASDKREAGQGWEEERRIPFTPERWRRLLAIQEAIAAARRQVAEVLEDASGARLDALPSISGPLLLGPEEKRLGEKLRAEIPRRRLP